MSILVNRDTIVICQGITGNAGSFHTAQCLAYGTRFAGGVTPGKGGRTVEMAGEDGGMISLPIWDTVQDAVDAGGATATMIFVPPPFAADAILEAANAGLSVICCITEGIPVLDMVRVKRALAADGFNGVLIGPNCPGIITPGQCKIGIMPGYIHQPGDIGIISRSGTLTYEAVWQVTQAGYGQSTCVGIGGDPVKGLNFTDALAMFESDPDTRGVILIGEIGGTDEEDAAAFIRDHMTKPVAAFIAGKTAPEGKRMGHAGAIISGGSGRAEDKINALRDSGVVIADYPHEIGKAILDAMGREPIRSAGGA